VDLTLVAARLSCLGLLWIVLALSTARAGETIPVSSSDELREALESVRGGETIALAPLPDGYELSANESVRPEAEVRIVSADPASPSRITTAVFRNTKNLTLDGLVFDSRTVFRQRDSWLSDINISSSQTISIINSNMVGSADAYVSLEGKGKAATNLALVTDSSEIAFTNNSIANYFHGLGILETRGLTIVGNMFEGIQGDAIRMGGITNTIIADNIFRDFWGSDQNLNHTDMIQLWSTNSKIVSENITIARNIMLSGDGAGSDAIFMRNELADQSPASPPSLFYRNIVIEDNLIQNSAFHGITVGEAEDVIIRNNTLLANPRSFIRWEQSKEAHAPGIQVAERSSRVEISGNVVSGWLNTPSDARLFANLVVSTDDTEDRNHVSNLFIGAAGGGRLPLTAFRVIPGSAADKPWLGAPITRFSKQPERLAAVFTSSETGAATGEFTFDASLTADNSGAVGPDRAAFTWDFGDGAQATGLKVVHRFVGNGAKRVVLSVRTSTGEVDSFWSYVDIPSPTLLNIASEPGAFSDTSPYKSSFLIEGIPDSISLVEGFPAFRIGGKRMVSIPRKNQQLFSLRKFGLSFYLRRSGGDAPETFVAGVYQSFGITVTSRGEIRFKVLSTKGEEMEVLSTRTPVNDGKWNHVAINYDAIRGETEIFFNGKLVGRGQSSGPTKPPESWDLTFGLNWGDAFDGYLSHIEIRREPYSKEDLRSLMLQVKPN
jgi:hypothetical protein